MKPGLAEALLATVLLWTLGTGTLVGTLAVLGWLDRWLDRPDD